MEIKEGHKYKTREGLIAKIWFIENNGDFPVKGAVYSPDLGEWFVESWTREGSVGSSDKEYIDDLIEEVSLLPITFFRYT